MSVPLTSHPQAFLDSPPPSFPLCHPRWPQWHLCGGQHSLQAVWAGGTEGSWALVFLNPGSGQPLKLAQGFSLGTADPEWEGGVASLALGGTLNKWGSYQPGR